MVCALLPARVFAQSPAAVSGADWPLERVRILGGTVLGGLVESESPTSIEFIEVRRPPGKGMNLVVRTIDRKDIVSWERLPTEEQNVLRERIEKFRLRADVEALRMSDARLTPIKRNGVVYWQYRGQWFLLESTTDEQTTRRAVARIDQVLLAYRHILPPRTQPQQRLQILLFGSPEQYRQFLSGLGLDIANPAFFLANFNLVVAGSDLNGFNAEMGQARRQHKTLSDEAEAALASLPERLKMLADELRDAGVAPAERQKILKAEQARAEQMHDELLREIKALDRKNAALFNQVAGQMFVRLYHEAFHAYLDGYVYPQQQFDVPRWLNEGLAQTFEAGFVEADTLRVDAPNQVALAALQADLQGPEPLGLAALLEADAGTFLATHRAGASRASRLYPYAWGLAYYLTFVQPVLATPVFEQYLQPAAKELPAVERFERLIGEPLDRFELRWRSAMLKLKRQ